MVPRMSRDDVVVLCAIGLFGMFGFSLLMLYGMREVPGAVGSVVMATTPAVTAAGAVAFMGERLSRRRAAGIGLAVAGVLTVDVGGGIDASAGGALWLGSALVIGAVCVEAAYTLLGMRLTADPSPLEVSALASAVGAVLFVPGGVWQAPGTTWGAPGTSGWLALSWWGLGTLALGSLLWYTGVQRVPGSLAAGFMGIMPVSALVASYAVLDESFRFVHLLGMALALAGMAVVLRSDSRSDEARPEPPEDSPEASESASSSAAA